MRSGFGSFLLTPAAGNGSLSTFLVDIFTPHISHLWAEKHVSPLIPALHVYFAGANSTWETALVSADLTDTSTVSRQAAVVSAGALVNWQVVRARLLNVPVQINVETGYSHKWLRGDVFPDTVFIRNALKVPASSDIERAWGAWENGFQMSIGAVTAAVQYYWVDGNNDENFVSGLTSGQLIIGIAVAGDVVSGVLSE